MSKQHEAVDFHFETNNGNAKVASFTLRYELDKATVTNKFEDVTEVLGYEFISVNLPRLVTVREEDPNAWLVHGDAGGSFAMLRNATPGTLAPNQFWGNVFGSLPVVMLGTATAMCVQETTAFMDDTSLTVTGENVKRRASIGTSKTYRVNGGDCLTWTWAWDTSELRPGDRVTLGMEGNSHIVLDWAKKSYSVVLTAWR
jgi:hypothetical protein